MEKNATSARWKQIVREEVGSIKPYVPGKPIREVKEEYELDSIIKLASNENPLPVPEAVEEAITREMKNINLYPDGATRSLRAKVAKMLNVDENMLTFGNGSDGLLKVIAETFLDNDSSVIISHPSFVEYKFVSQIMGCNLIRVCVSDYQHNLRGMLEAVNSDTEMIFLTSPDNPSGTIIGKERLEWFLDELPDDIIVVLDEAYCEFVQEEDYPNGIDYVKEGYPVIVLRTFSKAYGLAGLRLGYSITCPEMKKLLMKIRDPFNVNRLAEEAGKAVLDDEDYLPQVIENNEQGKEYLYAELDRLGLEYVPTHSNFILVKVGVDSMELFEEMLQRGVIIRPGDPLGYPEHIRVTIGLPEENEIFISALEEVLSVLSS
ncbi:MAG: histidinol-phosphate transaminase [Halanaerobiaceae bacterium]